MRNLITRLFIFFFIINANGQYQSKELLSYVIKNNSLRPYQNVIVAEIDTSIVEYTLRDIKSNKKVFKSIDASKAKISLTSKEKKFILNSLKKQNDINWTSEDFANIKVIKKEQIKKHVDENNQNAYIYISAPVFIRNGLVAIVFFANFYGDLAKSGGGINNLAFYKFENGTWQKWITLEAGIYN